MQVAHGNEYFSHFRNINEVVLPDSMFAAPTLIGRYCTIIGSLDMIYVRIDSISEAGGRPIRQGSYDQYQKRYTSNGHHLRAGD